MAVDPNVARPGVRPARRKVKARGRSTFPKPPGFGAKAGGTKKPPPGNPAGGYRFGPNPLDTTPGFRDEFSPPIATGPSAVPGPGRGRPRPGAKPVRPPAGDVVPKVMPWNPRPPRAGPGGGQAPGTAPWGAGFGAVSNGRVTSGMGMNERLPGRKLSVQPKNRKQGRKAPPRYTS